MASEYNVLWSFYAHLEGIGLGDKGVARFEATGQGILRRATEMVGPRDPLEQSHRDSRTRELSRQPSIGPGGGALFDQERRRQVLLDQGNGHFRELCRRAKSLEKDPGGFGSPLIVAARADPAIDLRRRGWLSKVVTQDCKHEGYVFNRL